jgi:phosphoglycolate phosphatase
LPILVFDLDGTLSNPFDGIWRSVNHALDAHGLPAVPRDSFQRFIGPPIDQSFRTLVPGAAPAVIESLVAAFRDRYGRLGYAENVLYPDIPAMLDRLASAGFRCGICTSKRRDFAVQVLELFELQHHFAFVAGGDVGVRKAAQLALLRAGGRIDDQAIMIGDRASDLEAAAANGLRAVGVTWGFGPLAELEDAGPWAITRSPPALADLLVPAA